MLHHTVFFLDSIEIPRKINTFTLAGGFRLHNQCGVAVPLAVELLLVLREEVGLREEVVLLRVAYQHPVQVLAEGVLASDASYAWQLTAPLVRLELLHAFGSNSVVRPHQIEIFSGVFLLEAPLKMFFADFSDERVHRIRNVDHQLGPLDLLSLNSCSRTRLLLRLSFLSVG